MRDLINNFLNLLGVRVENQQPGTESGIGAIFERDIQRQKFDYLNKPAPPRDSYGASEVTAYLKDGSAGTPRRR